MVHFIWRSGSEALIAKGPSAGPVVYPLILRLLTAELLALRPTAIAFTAWLGSPPEFLWPTPRPERESAISMKTLTPLSSVFLGAALAVAPSLGMSQQTPPPETAIPRHTEKGGNGNFVPPSDRKLPPDPHHDIPAHPNPAKRAPNAKKAKNGSNGRKSHGSVDDGSHAPNSH